MNGSQEAQDTVHVGRPRDGKQQTTNHGSGALRPHSRQSGQLQGGYPKGAGLSAARLHRRPWQTSPGAMETTGDRRACTQSRRGSPAKQIGPATQAKAVRRSYRRLAGAIPPMVRHTPYGWAASTAAAQWRGHVTLSTDTCVDTLPPETSGLGGCNTAFPITCGSGLRGT